MSLRIPLGTFQKWEESCLRDVVNLFRFCLFNCSMPFCHLASCWARSALCRVTRMRSTSDKKESPFPSGILLKRAVVQPVETRAESRMAAISSRDWITAETDGVIPEIYIPWLRLASGGKNHLTQNHFQRSHICNGCFPKWVDEYRIALSLNNKLIQAYMHLPLTTH